MRHIRITKPRLGGFMALALLGSTAIGAFAYFAAIGTTTTHVTTGGASSTWVFNNVTECATSCDSGSTATGGAITPGVNSDEIDFQVDNTAATAQTLRNITASATTDAQGGIFDVTSSAFVDTCKASWFTAAFETTTPGYLPLSIPSNTVSASGIMYVLVSMPANASVDQSACENLEPQITLNATG